MNEKELSVFERLAATQEAILARLQEFTAQERKDDPALGKLSEALLALAGAQQKLGTQQHPSNISPPEISVFNPRGDKDFPRPVLLCPIRPFWSQPFDAITLTREEIELLNVLIGGGDAEYQLRLTDGISVPVQVKAEWILGSDPKRAQFVEVSHPTLFSDERKDRIPDGWIRRMLMTRKETKGKAAAVLTMDEEHDLIEAGLLNNKEPADVVVSVGA